MGHIYLSCCLNATSLTPLGIDMSVSAHGPRLIDAFLKLKSDKLRGAVADLAQALARAG
jgi:hypothetical protein